MVEGMKWTGHAGFKLVDDRLKTVIYIDPYNLEEREKADIILITHSHFDHCSVADINKVADENTAIVATMDCASKLSGKIPTEKVTLTCPGKEMDINGIKISTVPAYNTNKRFHPKGNEWVGYIVEVNGKKIYHAGDTDIIPEMKGLEVDIALLPVSGTYVMDAEEAADAANNYIKADLYVPMHYGAGVAGTKEDAERFRGLVDGKVEVFPISQS